MSSSQLEHILLPLDKTERLLSLQMALKCSDLGHLAATLPVHLRWVSSLEEEVSEGWKEGIDASQGKRCGVMRHGEEGRGWVVGWCRLVGHPGPKSLFAMRGATSVFCYGHPWLGLLRLAAPFPCLQFFRQGDAEKLRGLPVSPLFDRDKQGVTKSQIGFFDIVGELMWGSV